MGDRRTPSAVIRSQIDLFLSASKTLGGTAIWMVGNRPDEERVVWPVLLGGRSCEATLQATAYPNDPELRFTIGLYWPDCIWRLDHDSMYKKHRNPLRDVQKNGLDPFVAGPHYHAWEDNRHLVRDRVRELPCARSMARRLSWAPSMRWFCGQTNLRMTTTQMVDFPRRRRLL
jgi:hypothetical protein